MKAKVFLICLLAVLYVTADSCLGESTIKCHCFTDRSYNPDDRFAADDYIRVTSFNSLLAKYYDISKRQIVMIKMNEGVAQDDLLISLELAKKTGIDLRKYLGLRRENKSWAEVIVGLSQQETIKKDRILQAVRSGMPAKEAGQMIADEMIAEVFRVEPEKLQTLRKSGLNEKEITLIHILSHTSEIPPEALMKLYKEQGRSWSEIAFNLGIEPNTAGKLILAYPAIEIPE